MRLPRRTSTISRRSPIWSGKIPFRWASIIGWVSAAGHSKQMISRGRRAGCARFQSRAHTWAHGGSEKLKCSEDDAQYPHTSTSTNLAGRQQRERCGWRLTEWLERGERTRNATCLRWSEAEPSVRHCSVCAVSTRRGEIEPRTAALCQHETKWCWKRT